MSNYNKKGFQPDSRPNKGGNQNKYPPKSKNNNTDDGKWVHDKFDELQREDKHVNQRNKNKNITRENPENSGMGRLASDQYDDDHEYYNYPNGGNRKIEGRRNRLSIDDENGWKHDKCEDPQTQKRYVANLNGNGQNNAYKANNSNSNNINNNKKKHQDQDIYQPRSKATKSNPQQQGGQDKQQDYKQTQYLYQNNNNNNNNKIISNQSNNNYYDKNQKSTTKSTSYYDQEDGVSNVSTAISNKDHGDSLQHEEATLFSEGPLPHQMGQNFNYDIVMTLPDRDVRITLQPENFNSDKILDQSLDQCLNELEYNVSLLMKINVLIQIRNNLFFTQFGQENSVFTTFEEKRGEIAVQVLLYNLILKYRNLRMEGDMEVKLRESFDLMSQTSRQESDEEILSGMEDQNMSCDQKMDISITNKDDTVPSDY